MSRQRRQGQVEFDHSTKGALPPLANVCRVNAVLHIRNHVDLWKWNLATRNRTMSFEKLTGKVRLTQEQRISLPPELHPTELQPLGTVDPLHLGARPLISNPAQGGLHHRAGSNTKDVIHIDNEKAKWIRMCIIVEDRLRVLRLADPHD
jgi:hypothetical protein